MIRKQTRLLVIATPHPRAAIIDLVRGGDGKLPPPCCAEDLLCGGCGALALPGWSVAATSTTLVVEAHLLLRCAACRAYNVVPTRRREAPGDTWLRRAPLRPRRAPAAPPPDARPAIMPLTLRSADTASSPFRSYIQKVRGSARS